jgi:hypothetical protein
MMSQEVEAYDERAEGEEPSFPGMSLQDFTERTSVYEHTPVPFSQQLRRTAHVGMICTCASLLIIAFLPTLVVYSQVLDWGHFVFFTLLNTLLYGYVGWLDTQSWLVYFNGTCLATVPVLLFYTYNLRRGAPWQYWLAFAHAIIGMLNLVLVLIPLALLLLKLLFWLLVLLIVIAIAIAFLRALFTR